MFWNIFLLLCESDGNKLSEGHPTLIVAALIVAGIHMVLLLLLLFMSLLCVRILAVFANACVSVWIWLFLSLS